MNYWETQLEGYGALVPDMPRNEPCYEVNKPLWAVFRRTHPHAVEHPIMTEQEIVRRLDCLYMSDGTCNVG